MKPCSICKKEKELSDFYAYQKYTCKVCWRIKCKEYRQNNPEKFKQSQRAQYLKKREERIQKAKIYKEKNPEREKINKLKRLQKNPRYYRAIDLKSKYNLTLDEYDKMILLQDNKCAICKNEFLKGYPYVDHCHSTGKTRGILCMGCNTSLGLLKENISILKSMIKYIKFHRPLQIKMKI